MRELAGVNVPHLRLVLKGFQRIVHELQEMRRYHQVVFQYDHPSVLVYYCGHTVDDVAGQPQVLRAFRQVYLPEAPGLPDYAPCFGYGGPVGFERAASE